MTRLYRSSAALLTAASLVVAVAGRAAAQQQQAAAPAISRLVGFEVSGGIDPPGRLEAFLASFIPPGSAFIEPGPLDFFGTPVSTVPRLTQALARLGYAAEVQTRPGKDASGAAGVMLSIRLRPFDRVRWIFVRGNWPLRQEEILRRLSLRPGQPLEPAGAGRDERLERERQNVVDYLHGQGYLEASVKLDLTDDGRVPAQVSVYVRIKLGPGYPIGPVSVTGSRTVPPEEVASALHHGDWRFLWTRPLPFKLSLMQEDLQSITQRIRALEHPGARVTTDFDPGRSIDPVRKEVRLGVFVDERKRITVGFEGNRRFDDDDLADSVTFAQRGAYDNYEATTTAETIARRYRSKGYMFARVRWRREPVTPDHDRIVFTIEEGPRLKVRGVDFAGNRAFTAGDLREVVATRVYPWLGDLGLGGGGYASVLQLEIDIERLSNVYNGAGYPGTKIRCEVAPAPGQYQPLATLRTPNAVWQRASQLYVRFLIEEAPRVDVTEIRFETAPGETLPRGEAFLRAHLLDTRVGGPYRPAAIRSDTERLRRVLGDQGHPHADVEPLVDRKDTSAVVTFQIKLGPRLVVGPVFLRGNFVTREGAIREWLRLDTGSLLTTTDLEHSQRNLALNQLFTNATPISFPAETTSGGTVPMVIEVEERHDHWGVLRVGGGGSTEQKAPDSEIPLGVYGALGYEHRNLFGQGWRFLSRGEYGTSQTKISADFVDPRLMGTLFRLELGASYLQQATVRLGDVRSGGGSIGLGREMYPGVDAIVRYSLRRTLRTEPLLRPAGPDAEQESVQIGTVVGAVGLAVEWQRLDNPLVPTRGFRIDGGIDFAAPALSFNAGDDTFIKVRARSLAVVPIASWISLRHTVRYDHGFPLAGASVLPKVERFFAGGDTTIRGYELDRARSEAIPAELVPGLVSYIYRPVGGSIRVLHSLDLQVPITGPWYAAVFIDSGVVADSFDGLGLTRFRHGAGIAPIMIRLPIGDLSFAWAWPLDPEPGDSRNGRLVFNVGLMF